MLNHNHPEILPGEVFVCNISGPGQETHERDWQDCRNVFPSARMGQDSFDIFDRPWPDARPVFVSEEEHDAQVEKMKRR